MLKPALLQTAPSPWAAPSWLAQAGPCWKGLSHPPARSRRKNTSLKQWVLRIYSQAGPTGSSQNMLRSAWRGTVAQAWDKGATRG